MAETKYKKLFGLLGVAALLAAGGTLTGCASAPTEKAASGSQGGGTEESAASSQSESGQGAAGASDQSGGGQASSADQTAGGKQAATKAPAAKPAAAEPAKPDISGSDVVSIENRMKLFPRVLWHSHTNTYRFYVGTVLFAEYGPYDDTFEVMTDNADHKNLVCKYSPDKGWQVTGKASGQTCDGLLKKMDLFLNNPFS